MRGVRIQSIVRELNDEKIDVIEWSSDPRVFIAKALSPARVSQVYLRPDAISGKTATVIVADDQLSLAIGREGQNARLAAKLTGWRIDIKSLTEATAEALSKRDDPLVADIVEAETTLIEQAEIILAKKEAGRPITAEDFQTLLNVINRIEGRYEDLAETERKAQEEARRAVPPLFWQMPLSILGLDEEIELSLVQSGFETVGHIMASFGYDPGQLKKHAELDDAPFADLQERMATTDFPKTASELEQLLPDAEGVEREGPVAEEPVIGEEELVVEEAAETPAEVGEPDAAEEPLTEEPLVALYEEPPEEILLDAPEPEIPAEPEPVVVEEKPAPQAPVITLARREEDEEVPAKKRKGKRKRRRLVYDEDVGAVIAQRKRRRGGQGEWDEYLD
jgi:N utilization substance protein A